MLRSEIHKEFFSVEEEEEKEQEGLTLFELQRVVMDLAKRVAKLERHHAKF